MQPLSRAISSLRPHYVVAGSGYGGGFAASRLTEMPAETMMPGSNGKPGLYDLRAGEHMHVLVGCGSINVHSASVKSLG